MSQLKPVRVKMRLFFPLKVTTIQALYFRAAVQDGNLVLKDGLEWYTLTFQGVTFIDEIKDTFVKKWEGYNGNLGGILYNTVSGSSADDDGGNNAPADNDIINELAEFKKNLSKLSDEQNESLIDSAEKLKEELEKIKNNGSVK